VSDVVIRAEKLSKRYRLSQSQHSATLRDEIAHTFALPRRFFSHHPTGNDKTDPWLWALRDVEFAINDGEAVGVIGRNGAGKSTLLKILARITMPTAGFAHIRGRIGSLIEIGTGFHPELSGRENIFLNGAILGMKHREIQRQFDEIVAFAEVEKFLDTPVKHYSSGMYLRLAFAVAAHLNPEILLVDEVLAVGDAEFQKKCLGKMSDVTQSGRTVLFVSHNMGAVNRLCTRTLWLDQGKLVMDGPTDQVIAQYLTSKAGARGAVEWQHGIANDGVDELEIYSVRLVNSAGQVASNFDVQKSFTVEIRYRINKALPYCRVGVLLGTYDGTLLFETYDADDEKNLGRRHPGDYIVSCQIPADLLNPGNYIISINAGMPNIKNLAFLEGVLVFSIEDTGAVGSPLHSKRGGVIRPKLNWNCIEVNNVALA
jgi:lipopolysaccharide transport system ATP-binding protein